MNHSTIFCPPAPTLSLKVPSVKNIIFAMLVLCCSFVSIPPTSAADLLVNGGFEKELAGWSQSNYLFTKEWKDSFKAKVAFDENKRKEGRRSLRVYCKTKTHGTILHSSRVEYKKDKIYRLTGWMKGNSGQVWIRQNGHDAKGKMIPGSFSVIFKETVKHDWEKFSLTFVKPKKGVAGVSFTFFIGGTPGTLWLDDLSLSESDPGEKPEVHFRLTPNYYTDNNVYHLSENQPMIVFMTPSNPTAYSPVKPMIEITLPKGVELTSPGYDSEILSVHKTKVRTKTYTRYRTRFGLSKTLFESSDFSKPSYRSTVLTLTSKLKPGHRVLTGYINVLDKGVRGPKSEFKIKTIASINPANVPKRFKTGIFSGTSVEMSGSALEQWMTFYKGCGFNSILINDNLRAGGQSVEARFRSPEEVFRQANNAGLRTILQADRFSNCYRFSNYPFRRKVPKSAWFVSGNGKTLTGVFDPAYIMAKGEWFLKSLDYSLMEMTKYNCNTVWSNWEPHQYILAKGCFSKASLAQFAKHSGLDEQEILKMPPKEIALKYREKLLKFQAWQFGQCMKIINERFAEYQKKTGKEATLEACFGPMFLQEYDPDGWAPDYRLGFDSDQWLPYHKVASSWQYTFFKSNEMKNETLKKLKDLGYRRKETAKHGFASTSHKNTYDAVESYTGYLKAFCKKKSLPEIPYVHLINGSLENNWVVEPDAIRLQMLAAFVGGAEGVNLYYFPKGYDARYWQAARDANDKIAFYEEMVMGGTPSQESVDFKVLSNFQGLKEYSDRVIYRCFKHQGKLVLAVCNFDMVSPAVVNFSFKGLSTNEKQTLHMPYLKRHIKMGNAVEFRSAVPWEIAPSTINFFVLEPHKNTANYGKKEPYQLSSRRLKEIDNGFKTRLKQIEKLAK